MSMLPPEVNVELTQLLQALQSSDNTVRSQAEDHLATHWTNERPDILLMGLVEQIQGSPDTTVRDIIPVAAEFVQGLIDNADTIICVSYLQAHSLEKQKTPK